MPSLRHDALLLLFRNRLTLAPELLRDVLHAPVPPFEQVRVADADVTEVVPTEYRADLVLVLERAGKPPKAPPEVAIVLEAQLRPDPDKPFSWPAYLAGFRARLRCDVVLVVVTADAATARWASKPIAMGHPGWVLTPLVVGPDVVPVVRDEQTAERAPELAVLSAVVHGDGPDAAEVGKAALFGARGLDDERATLYADLVFASVHGAARAAVEALMANGTYEYQSDFAKRYVAQGRAEGRAEGEARGKAHAVLGVLTARGVAVPEAVGERILACSDLATLDRWLARAVTAATATDVIDA